MTSRENHIKVMIQLLYNGLKMNEKLMKKLEKITADDIKKALEAKLDEWEDYIREVDRRNLKAAKLARNFWVRG